MVVAHSAWWVGMGLMVNGMLVVLTIGGSGSAFACSAGSGCWCLSSATEIGSSYRHVVEGESCTFAIMMTKLWECVCSRMVHKSRTVVACGGMYSGSEFVLPLCSAMDW